LRRARLRSAFRFAWQQPRLRREAAVPLAAVVVHTAAAVVVVHTAAAVVVVHTAAAAAARISAVAVVEHTLAAAAVVRASAVAAVVHTFAVAVAAAPILPRTRLRICREAKLAAAGTSLRIRRASHRIPRMSAARHSTPQAMV
jgi:hypothetical protein